MYTQTVELAGRGLLLMPSAFASLRAAAITRAPRQPTVIYPARGVSMLWEPRAEADPSARAALARVIGDARARPLTALDVPRSSTDLIQRTGLSAASVSEHLTALREAGLVGSLRSGAVPPARAQSQAEQLLSSV